MAERYGDALTRSIKKHSGDLVEVPYVKAGPKMGFTASDRILDEEEVMAHIHRARALLQPSPVRLGHVPLWLEERIYLAAEYGILQVDKSIRRLSARRILENRDCGKNFLQHRGSTLVTQEYGHFLGLPPGEAEVFVSEPYDWREGCINNFCGAFGLKFFFSMNAWHYPGRTIRIVFRPATDEEMEGNTARRQPCDCQQ
jgi:hypothetical protein